MSNGSAEILCTHMYPSIILSDTHAHTHTYTHTQTYIHTYMYTHTHTHTHTQRCSKISKIRKNEQGHIIHCKNMKYLEFILNSNYNSNSNMMLYLSLCLSLFSLSSSSLPVSCAFSAFFNPSYSLDTT